MNLTTTPWRGTRASVARALALTLAGLLLLLTPALAQESPEATPSAADEAAVRAIPAMVVEAWARGDGEGVAAAFTADVDFIAGDGRLVQGREALVPYFQEQFDTWLAGSRSAAEVINVRFLRDDVAVVHTLGGIMFPGETDVQPDWVGIQTWVVIKEDGEWRAAAYQNSRVLPEVQADAATPTAESDAASIEALVRRYYDIAGSGDLDKLGEVLTPDFTIQNAPPDEDAGWEGLIFNLERARVSRPDFSFHIDDLIVEGDAVGVRTTISGTHLGDFFGAPPTGKWIEIPAIDLWQVADGKLAAVWHFEDILGMMEQIGMIPGTSTPAPALTPNPSPSALGEGSVGVDLAANVALARRFHDEIFAQGNLDAADAILAPDVVWYRDVPPGVEGVKTFASTTRAAFPDLMLTADQVVASGDRVAIIWTLCGTQQGAFLGVPATGNPIATSGIDIYRIANGRIAEIWTVGDDLGLLFQLGAFPVVTNGAAATPDA